MVLTRLASQSSRYPIHTVVIVSLLATTAYIHLFEIARDGGIDFGTSFTNNLSLDLRSIEGVLVGNKGIDEKWEWEHKENLYNVETDSLNLNILQFDHPYLDKRKELVDLFVDMCIKKPNTDMCLYYGNETSSRIILKDLSPLLVFELEQRIQNLRTENLVYSKRKHYLQQNINNPGIIIYWLRNNAYSIFEKIWRHIRDTDIIDIAVLLIGYISMNLVFILLFLNMRTLGSNFWLATVVLTSGTFAFLFALNTVNYFGDNINPLVLSKKIPFLAVTVGFEKPSLLTRAVLNSSPDINTNPIRENVVNAVRDKGWIIVRDYLFEIGILILGAMSGVDGLNQFCKVAAWILGFDCLLLFTFYIAVLSIKLEINRIKQLAGVQSILEKNILLQETIYDMTNNNSYKPSNNVNEKKSTNIGIYNVFGYHNVKESSISRFKLIMTSCFFLINFLNLCTFPFQTVNHLKSSSSKEFRIIRINPLETYEIHDLLNKLIHDIHPSIQKVSLNVLPVFTLKAINKPFSFDAVLESLELSVKSISDPIMNKWIMIILILSIIFNAYLFNVARWVTPVQISLKTQDSSSHMIDKIKKITKDTSNYLEEDSSGNISNDDEIRPMDKCEELLKKGLTHLMKDEEILQLTLHSKIPGYALEKVLNDPERAVRIRRSFISRKSHTKVLETSALPFKDYDYARIMGACCENVIGYVPIPVGVAGPLLVDDIEVYLPMATTEGVLVASTARGCKAINASGGVTTILVQDLMTRGPCVSFPTVSRTGMVKVWLDTEHGQNAIKKAFNSTSRFARLSSVKSTIAGTNLYIRFSTTTGDAMGMNMVSKGVENVLKAMVEDLGFDDMRIISISGNYCTDKKPAAVNWIEGRGKSVIAEATIMKDIVKSVLKCNVDDLVELNISKNLIGSSMAGSIGGFNAHSANIVAALFIALGQDPAQVVESANCITLMKNINGNLHITVSMPSIEVGTIGGGTILEPQSALLDLLGVRGPHPTTPGNNAKRLARIVAAAVLAGELSLCSALTAGHLVKSHMQHNRSSLNTPISSCSSTPRL
ncbi:hydroxymethylglutaryl-CoA reductase (NADPH) [Pneumocystis carinii B80]|uniref:3-hydroxy-3-methylglutaryl coenzyme A reductase n=1 Tax=Pneumocystis carinii (strain B80) TaxID=1408658 RepID=A0A0W4ZEL2_PNEC8|nr:hydroxymethylglutaryl-CoA reductase (NADPH) [Pneumocystis carinii B80]KTW26778.1 hydroxymethylglutaryl-CoA reductase (NADPH) [Pneumocystis carinii B80]